MADIGRLLGLNDRLNRTGQDSRSCKSEVGNLHHLELFWKELNGLKEWMEYNAKTNVIDELV